MRRLGRKVAKPSLSYVLSAIGILSIVVALLGLQAVVDWRRGTSHVRILSGTEYEGLDSVSVPIIKAADLGQSTTEQILDSRKIILDSMSQLTSGAYVPTAAVFSDLIENVRWMTVGKLFFHGKGDYNGKRVYTESAASRAILNPLLLAKAEFFGLSIWGPENLVWKKVDYSLSDLADQNVPLAPRETSLVYRPKESIASVLYDVTAYLQQIKPYIAKPLNVDSTAFSVDLQNARDLGFRYSYLDVKGSQNIKNDKQADKPSKIDDSFKFIQASWNHMKFNHQSPTPSERDWIVATSLPATAVVKLWEHSPESAESAADFTFLINIK